MYYKAKRFIHTLKYQGLIHVESNVLKRTRASLTAILNAKPAETLIGSLSQNNTFDFPIYKEPKTLLMIQHTRTHGRKL